MAFGSFNQEKQEMSEINVTPLVDVMLVLLIVFMITMPVLTQTIPLQLPTANVEKVQEDQNKDILRIAINQDGTYIDQDLMSEEELKTVFENLATKNKQAIIAISADKEVAYKNVVKVLELAQQAGLQKVGFVTEQQGKSE